MRNCTDLWHWQPVPNTADTQRAGWLWSAHAPWGLAFTAVFKSSDWVGEVFLFWCRITICWWRPTSWQGGIRYQSFFSENFPCLQFFSPTTSNETGQQLVSLDIVYSSQLQHKDINYCKLSPILDNVVQTTINWWQLWSIDGTSYVWTPLSSVGLSLPMTVRFWERKKSSYNFDLFNFSGCKNLEAVDILHQTKSAKLSGLTITMEQ